MAHLCTKLEHRRPSPLCSRCLEDQIIKMRKRIADLEKVVEMAEENLVETVKRYEQEVERLQEKWEETNRRRLNAIRKIEKLQPRLNDTVFDLETKIMTLTSQLERAREGLVKILKWARSRSNQFDKNEAIMQIAEKLLEQGDG